MNKTIPSDPPRRRSHAYILPLFMAIYLLVIAYYTRGRATTEPLFYYGVLAGSAAIIVALYFVLKKKEKIRAKRDQELRELEDKNSYGTYADNPDDTDK